MLRESYQITNFEGLDNLVCSRIKYKSQIIAILISSLKVVLTDFSPKKEEGTGIFYIKEYQSKRRIFFSVNDEEDKVMKHFSFIFPFGILKNEGEIYFTLNNCRQPIDLYTLEILSALSDNKWFCDNNENNHDILIFFESYMDAIGEFNVSAEFETELWSIIKLLLTFEPGYIRYDYDVENFIEHVHPLHHIDVYYSDIGTFKLGLHESVNISERLEFSTFEDILLDGAKRSKYCYKLI